MYWIYGDLVMKFCRAVVIHSVDSIVLVQEARDSLSSWATISFLSRILLHTTDDRH